MKKSSSNGSKKANTTARKSIVTLTSPDDDNTTNIEGAVNFTSSVGDEFTSQTSTIQIPVPPSSGAPLSSSGRRDSVSATKKRSSGRKQSGDRSSTNNQQQETRKFFTSTSDAVTMTAEEDFPLRGGHHNYSPLLTRGDKDAVGSNFMKGLMKRTKHQKEEQDPAVYSIPTSPTTSNTKLVHRQGDDGDDVEDPFDKIKRIDSSASLGNDQQMLMQNQNQNAFGQFERLDSGISGGSGGVDQRRRSSVTGVRTIASRRASLASGIGIVMETGSQQSGTSQQVPYQHEQRNPRPVSSSRLSQYSSSSSSKKSLHQQQHGPRRMMRPSELEDPTIFPKMKIAGVDDSDEDEDEEAKNIISSNGGGARIIRSGAQQSSSSSKSDNDLLSKDPSKMTHQEKIAAERAQKEKQMMKDAEHVDQEERLLKQLQDESRMRKAVTLPDEVLTLVRKLRSAADIIGSSEGAPPPDALREVAIHSASLARFVSTWTLKQLAEKESHEISLQRQWLSDAARELKSRAENFSWSTATNSPILNSVTQRVNNNNNNNKNGKNSSSSAKQHQNHQSNINNNNNAATWPKAYAAITASFGPWILSTLYLVMDSLMHTVQCDRGAIFVPDDAGKIVSVCLVGAGAIARPIRVSRGHGVVGEVFRSGVAVNVLSTEHATKRNEEIFSRDVDNSTGFYTRNLLAVPVFAVGEDLVNPENNEKITGTRAEEEAEANNPDKKNVKALVGRARVVAVIELINKLVPANGEFTPSDELLVAQVGSVVASMIAACGGILQLGTETALQHSHELQAKLLSMRPAVVKARKQFLTATTAGCDSEETSTGRYSFTQVLNLHDEQRVRERNIAMMQEDQSSAADLSKCGASNEKIQQVSRIGGASTKVLRIGGDGGKNTEVERALQDMASFVGRIEAAWAGTRERCVMAEAEANASRDAYLKLEAELLELKRLAHACGIIKMDDELLGVSNSHTRTTSALDHNNNNIASPTSARLSRQGSGAALATALANELAKQQQQQGNNNSINNNNDDNNNNHNHSPTSRPGSSRSTATGGTQQTMTDDQAILERLLHAGDPNDHWESSKASFLDFFQSRTSSYKKAAAVETMQSRNLNVMKEKASTSTVGKTMKDLQNTSLADHLMRAGDTESLLKSANSTRHRHRMHHNRSIKEKAEVDPLSLSCQKMKDHVSRQEREMAELIAKHQVETKQLYLDLLANPQTNGVKEESLFEDRTAQKNSSNNNPSSNSIRVKKKGYNNGVDGVGDGSNEAESAGFRLLAQEFISQKKVN